MPSTILNGEILSLLACVRSPQTLVIADRGFPFWSKLHTIDLSLIDGIPRVADVLLALQDERNIRRIWIAEEFFLDNSSALRQPLEVILDRFQVCREPHEQFKQRVPGAVGLIRTGDTLQYSNLVLKMD